MRPVVTVRIGGLALIIGALAFTAVFAFLATRFDYPAILDGPASTVLPRLLETGDSGRTAWVVYALLPLIWLPAGVGAYIALRRFYPGAMLLALQFALLSAVSMMFGLMRWPSIHWHLALLQATATPEQQQVIAAIYDGLNTYLGKYIGEFLGEFSFNCFFILSSVALVRSRGSTAWVGMLGLVVAFLGLIGMLRNITSVVAPVAAINNYLLPLWMIIFGVTLLRYRVTEAATAVIGELPANRPPSVIM